ncbi:MAG: tryptophan-rich sensory protein [Bacteroidales bacterium]|nr:tryptophan-rich sensory protein [Bacteroidales bacterium]
MILRLIVFLALNFAALGIGGLFTGKGVPSEWYASLDKAPWTPPGWVFGLAWTTIMICFAVYMAQAWQVVETRRLLIGLFILQWILNVSWNPVFFHFHQVSAGLAIITLLTLLVGYMMFKYWPSLKLFSLLLVPYFIWLLIATSLNAYILVKN